MSFTIVPLTTERWSDFEQVMGPNGAMSGCWCMWFRLTNPEFNGMAGDPNREAMRGLVEDECIPGLLAYEDDEAVGWVSLAPRAEFSRIPRSKFFEKVDDEQVWSIVCFYVPRRRRGKGAMRALLAGAIEFARDRGATILEAYPRDPATARVSSDGAFVGLEPIFRDAGFVEVARRDPKRPIMRLRL